MARMRHEWSMQVSGSGGHLCGSRSPLVAFAGLPLGAAVHQDPKGDGTATARQHQPAICTSVLLLQWALRCCDVIILESLISGQILRIRICAPKCAPVILPASLLGLGCDIMPVLLLQAPAAPGCITSDRLSKRADALFRGWSSPLYSLTTTAL